MDGEGNHINLINRVRGMDKLEEDMVKKFPSQFSFLMLTLLLTSFGLEYINTQPRSSLCALRDIKFDKLSL